MDWWLIRPGWGRRRVVYVLSRKSAPGHRESSVGGWRWCLDVGRGLRRSQLPPSECVTGSGSLQASSDTLNLWRVTRCTFRNAHSLP